MSAEIRSSPGEQRQQLAQRDHRLEPGERRAEAEVDPVPEREVAPPVAPHGEPVGIRAQRRVAVGRPDEHEDEGASRNRYSG